MNHQTEIRPTRPLIITDTEPDDPILHSFVPTAQFLPTKRSEDVLFDIHFNHCKQTTVSGISDACHELTMNCYRLGLVPVHFSLCHVEGDPSTLAICPMTLILPGQHYPPGTPEYPYEGAPVATATETGYSFIEDQHIFALAR